MGVGEVIFVAFLLVATLAMQARLWVGFRASRGRRDRAGMYVALLVFLGAIQSLALRSLLELKLGPEMLADVLSVGGALLFLWGGNLLSRARRPGP